MQLSYLKRSVGLVTAATYVMATGILTSVTLGSVKLINKAKVSELVREMAFYDNANAKFVGRYNALPGLLSYSKCMTFPEFSKNCRRQDDINLTTNEYVYKDSRCSVAIGCTLQNNGADGKQAGEDVFRNFLLPMRYLKDAGLGYVKTTGLSKQLFSTENLTKQTWAESKAGDGVYVNIYNYYNVSGFGGYFLFNNNSIMGHTTSSDKSFDHYDKLMEGDNQYLVYHRFGDKRGALSVQNVKALDKKIDDGKPMTGRLTTYSTDSFSGNFAKSEYSKCITAEPSSYDVLKSIDYNIDTKTGGGGYCNFTYQLKNVAEMVNNNTEIRFVDGNNNNTENRFVDVNNNNTSYCKKYCPTNNPSTDSGCDASVSATNHYKCTFVAGTRSGDCEEQAEAKYCPTNNPSTDSGCDASVSATNHYKCTFVAGTRSGDCEEQAEAKYCPTNDPNTDSGCDTSVSATNHYKCTFVAGTRSGDCAELIEDKYCKVTKNPDYNNDCNAKSYRDAVLRCMFLDKKLQWCAIVELNLYYSYTGQGNYRFYSYPPLLYAYSNDYHTYYNHCTTLGCDSPIYNNFINKSIGDAVEWVFWEIRYEDNAKVNNFRIDFFPVSYLQIECNPDLVRRGYCEEIISENQKLGGDFAIAYRNNNYHWTINNLPNILFILRDDVKLYISITGGYYDYYRGLSPAHNYRA